jgi:hypothetical protein
MGLDLLDGVCSLSACCFQSSQLRFGVDDPFGRCFLFQAQQSLTEGLQAMAHPNRANPSGGDPDPSMLQLV